MAEMDRVPWAEKTDLFLLFMAGSVGLGNIYSFPLAVYRNGYGKSKHGSASAIAYILVRTSPLQTTSRRTVDFSASLQLER